MRHTFLVVTVKRWLKSVYIYGSDPEIKTGVLLFWTTPYILCHTDQKAASSSSQLQAGPDTTRRQLTAEATVVK